MEQRTRDVISATAFFAFVALFLTAAVGFDIFAAGDSALAEGIVIVLFGVPMVMSERFWRRRWKSWTCVACWLIALALVLTPWHPRKRFVQRLDSIHRGMTVDEVEAVMSQYIEGVGAKWFVLDEPEPPEFPARSERASYDGTLVYRWNDHDWQYDADVGFVEFAHGRVVHVEFMPD